jgi:hypothetical protein
MIGVIIPMELSIPGTLIKTRHGKPGRLKAALFLIDLLATALSGV